MHEGLAAAERYLALFRVDRPTLQRVFCELQKTRRVGR